MECLAVGKYNFSEILNQVLDNIRCEILKTYKATLEQALQSAPDEVIGNKRYNRGIPYKRWGYMIRKWI